MREFSLWVMVICLAQPVLAEDYRLLTAEIPPFTSMEEGYKGLFLDVIEELMQRTGDKVELVYQPWKRSQADVAMASADKKMLIAPLTRVLEREAKYDWILQIYQYSMVFVALDPRVEINNMEALKQVPVCVIRESPGQYKLRRLNFANIVDRGDESQCYKMLESGRVKAVFSHGVIMSRWNYTRQGGEANKLIFGARFPAIPIFMSSSKGVINDESKARFHIAFDEMVVDGTYRQILDKYEKRF